jgi:thioredoxin reductase
MSASNHPEIFDITFIGAGPSGLFGAFYAGLRELSVKIIDTLPQAGGQLIALYPEKTIYDVPGLPEILSKQLAANLFEQANRWHPTVLLGERAHTLRRVTLPEAESLAQGWVIETDRGEHWTRTLVLTAGIGAFEPTRLNNKSVDRYEGRGVHYLVQDLNAFSGHKVLVIGGGDSAVDWALAVQRLAKEVTLIHRREGFRAHDSSVNALKESPVNVRLFYELDEVQGNQHIERAVIFDNRTGERQTIDIDDVILALGFKADLGPIRDWGLELMGRRFIKVNNRMETSLPGVYAAGDLALQEGLDPLNLIVIGFGQVTVAVNYAYAQLKPGGKVFPGHSSTMMAGSS